MDRLSITYIKQNRRTRQDVVQSTSKKFDWNKCMLCLWAFINNYFYISNKKFVFYL